MILVASWQGHTCRISGTDEVPAIKATAAFSSQGRYMMTLSDGYVFRVTGPFCGEFIGHRWIHLTDQWHGALMFSFICAWTNGWVNNRAPGDLKTNRVIKKKFVINLFRLTTKKSSKLSIKLACSRGNQRWPTKSLHNEHGKGKRYQNVKMSSSNYWHLWTSTKETISSRVSSRETKNIYSHM